MKMSKMIVVVSGSDLSDLNLLSNSYLEMRSYLGDGQIHLSSTCSIFQKGASGQRNLIKIAALQLLESWKMCICQKIVPKNPSFQQMCPTTNTAQRKKGLWTASCSVWHSTIKF